MKSAEDGKQFIAPPILKLSAEKMTKYGMFLMDYGMVLDISLYIRVSVALICFRVLFIGYVHLGVQRLSA